MPRKRVYFINILKTAISTRIKRDICVFLYTHLYLIYKTIRTHTHTREANTQILKTYSDFVFLNKVKMIISVLIIQILSCVSSHMFSQSVKL